MYISFETIRESFDDDRCCLSMAILINECRKSIRNVVADIVVSSSAGDDNGGTVVLRPVVALIIVVVSTTRSVSGTRFCSKSLIAISYCRFPIISVDSCISCPGPDSVHWLPPK